MATKSTIKYLLSSVGAFDGNRKPVKPCTFLFFDIDILLGNAPLNGCFSHYPANVASEYQSLCDGRITVL